MKVVKEILQSASLHADPDGAVGRACSPNGKSSSRGPLIGELRIPRLELVTPHNLIRRVIDSAYGKRWSMWSHGGIA